MYCAIIGDSLGQGVAAAVPYCYSDSVVGINSTAFSLAHTKTVNADEVLITLGTNDYPGQNTRAALELVRLRVQGRVTWLLSGYNLAAHDAALEVARKYNDRVLEAAPYQVPGRMHPNAAGYHTLASAWLNYK